MGPGRRALPGCLPRVVQLSINHRGHRDLRENLGYFFSVPSVFSVVIKLGWRRVGAACGVATLCAGVLYGAVASVRLYGGVFERPASGSVFTPDEYLAVVDVSGDDVSKAVAHAGWEGDATVVLLADDRTLNRQDIYQTYYSTSYALYPRRVWLWPGCGLEAAFTAARTYGTRHVIAIGPQRCYLREREQVTFAWARPVSPKFALVDLP